MKGLLIPLGLLILVAGAGRLAAMPSLSGERLAQCVPTELPSPEEEDETPPPKPAA